MASSCLVPEFPAVLVAVEHLKELEQQLRDEAAAFSPAASLHLAEITAAITELEADRRAAHELLEVETIENSKLRHQLAGISDRMSREIMADVAAARAANAEEIERLRADLGSAARLQEAATKRLKALVGQNEALRLERDVVKAGQEDAAAALNHQISVKFGLQARLDRTQQQIEELKSCIGAAERDKTTLERDAELERDAITAERDRTSGEADAVEEDIARQKQAIRDSRGDLEVANARKRESHDRLRGIAAHAATLDNGLQRLTASRRQLEERLDAEALDRRELRERKAALEVEMKETREAFRDHVRRLKEEIAAVEEKVQEGRVTAAAGRHSLSQVYDIFTRRRGEEKEARAEHLLVSQRLERSKLQLEERIASIVKRSREIREMDRQIGELLEADSINKRVFERDQEELSGNMDVEKRNIGHMKEERERLLRLLEEAKEAQREHVAKVTSDIDAARRRYEELRREEAGLLRCQPLSADAESMASHVTRSEEEYRETEAACRQENRRLAAEAEGVVRSEEEKRRAAEEEEAALAEVESECEEQRARHGVLVTQTSKLRGRSGDLEAKIRALTEETGALLRPRGEMAAELEELRAGRAAALAGRFWALRTVELSIYDSNRKLEQVDMENSRLRLRLRQMEDDVAGATEDRDRYRRDRLRLDRDTRALLEGLQDAWRRDAALTRDSQGADGVLLASVGALMNRLTTRRRRLENVNAMLHQRMLDFSKRLGDKTAVEQQS